MKAEHKYIAATLLSILLGVYIFASLIFFTSGYDDKVRHQLYNREDKCSFQTRMTVYVFPSYKLGCWLGERINDE